MKVKFDGGVSRENCEKLMSDVLGYQMTNKKLNGDIRTLTTENRALRRENARLRKRYSRELKRCR